ncbi:MAG: sulfatase-like hydrolase/transferase [Verrucomicrobiales bacterium]|nr:sulfatase-like hydrolase/transferase [Verrucomicrobiales bacterium]
MRDFAVPPRLGPSWPRRRFLKNLAAGTSLIAAGSSWHLLGQSSAPKAAYRGPNVILIRFGGGARRRETIESAHTYSPFLSRDLIRRGTLFANMEIAQIKGLNTSHGEGTLNIVTGHYDQYKDIGNKFLGARFEPKVPTVFEYLRKSFAVPPHQTLIVNGEDRPDEEFYTFSNHFAYGIDYRSNMLSLYRFKAWLMRQQIAEGKLSEKEITDKRKELAKWEKVDLRTKGDDRQGPELESFWQHWREYYGDSGLVNPRGDRLLTELAVRAIKELRPRMLMVNYQDCDYVHWGYMSHYTRAVAIMDEGLKQIVEAVERDEEYRDNTMFVVVPDCGRDSNPFADVPCQHHFNSRSSHEIFALFVGPGVPRGHVVDRVVDQSQIATTIARLMGFNAECAEQRVLDEAIA